MARILIRNSDVYIFDESISNLDMESKEIIKKIIRDNLKEKICIFVMHDDYLNDLINKSIYLEKGSI